MKEDLNSSAFRRRLNVGTARSEDGREFQARTAATGNARSPSVERDDQSLRQTDIASSDRRMQFYHKSKPT